MAARKVKKTASTDETKQDLASFTLPSPEELAVPDKEKSENSFLNTSSLPDTTKEEIFWNSRRGKLWMSAFGVSIVLALIMGLFIYREGIARSHINTQSVSPTPGPSPTLTPQPMTEKSEEISISGYRIKILNGSGIQGEAARAKTLLEQEGFTVVSIGNAGQSNFASTIIQIKKDAPQTLINKLKSVLEKMYVIEVLSDDGESDVVVTVGSSRRESKE